MNNSVQEMLKQRKEYLERLQRSVNKKTADTPEGSLRISRSHNRVQYFHRKNKSDRTGEYISKQENELITKLAQKGYDEKVRISIQEELKAIRTFERLLPKVSVEDLYETFSKERKSLIEPVVETAEMFAEKWQNVFYKGKEFPPDFPELYTDHDERVRSKSEVIIANTLRQEGIPYRYEYPVKLNGFGYVYPDFTVLNIRLRKELYWEHLGMMDDPDYCRKNIRKLSGYIRNGIFPGSGLILSAETSSQPINTKDIRILIHQYLI